MTLCAEKRLEKKMATLKGIHIHHTEVSHRILDGAKATTQIQRQAQNGTYAYDECLQKPWLCSCLALLTHLLTWRVGLAYQMYFQTLAASNCNVWFERAWATRREKVCLDLGLQF